jgi:hypothetical protein
MLPRNHNNSAFLNLTPPGCIRRGTMSGHRLLLWLPKGRVQYRPEMNDPPQQNKSEGHRQHELDDSHSQPSLQQLTKTGDKKASQRREDVPSRSLTCHRCLRRDESRDCRDVRRTGRASAYRRRARTYAAHSRSVLKPVNA